MYYIFHFADSVTRTPTTTTLNVPTTTTTTTLPTTTSLTTSEYNWAGNTKANKRLQIPIDLVLRIRKINIEINRFNMNTCN